MNLIESSPLFSLDMNGGEANCPLKKQKQEPLIRDLFLTTTFRVYPDTNTFYLYTVFLAIEIKIFNSLYVSRLQGTFY